MLEEFIYQNPRLISFELAREYPVKGVASGPPSPDPEPPDPEPDPDDEL